MRKELIPDFYNQFLAKPRESLYDHTYKLLCCLDDLRSYLSDDEYVLLEFCCIYHDIGKINGMFQKRVSSDGKLRFDKSKEVGHNILSFLYVFNNTECIPDEFDHLSLIHI